MPSLTRLAAALPIGSGKARMFVIVGAPASPSDQDRAWTVTVNGGGANATQGVTADGLYQPRVVAFANGIDQSLVPDGVARVRWVFSGRSVDGMRLRGPVTIRAGVRDNVAISPSVRGQGMLAEAAWYAPDGRVLARYRSSELGPSAQQQPPIHTVPATLQHAFAVFRRLRTASDELPHGLRGSDAGYGGANPGLSQLVIATPRMQLWIVPGRLSSCSWSKAAEAAEAARPTAQSKCAAWWEVSSAQARAEVVRSSP